MKKILGILAVCLMLVCMASCGEDDGESHITLTISGDSVDWSSGVSGVNGGQAYAYIEAGTSNRGERFVMVAAGEVFNLPVTPNNMPSDGISLAIQLDYSSSVFVVGIVYDAPENGGVVRDGAMYDFVAGSMKLKFTEIGEEGGMIRGTFSCSIRPQTGADISITNGVVNLKRVAASGASNPFGG
ncbi:MAG: hypothetical protein LBC99_10630 [Spirochaetota bacterium]|jgi:hypothetical protein|nr:hypothetical protein [Spirochaetota bacterium]